MNEVRVGRFRLIGCIARGGMAEIYLGRPNNPEDADAGAEVAIKRLFPEHQSEREFIQMFFDEARLAAQLDHPNIVRIVEVNEAPPTPFIAMELLRGANLRDIRARLRQIAEPIPPELAALLAVGVLRGLGHAHTLRDHRGPLNIVHRDVSPPNIVITYDGAVKLLDFGIARTNHQLHKTQAGLYKGKFAYMSPEQLRGQSVDGRSDLFALTEVLYELLLQRHPFEATTEVGIIRKVQHEAPTPPRNIAPKFPKDLSDILLKSLEKNPDLRFRNAEDMETALVQWINTQTPRPTFSDLARFLRSLFADRLNEEEDARRHSNDAALVKVLRGQSLYRPTWTPPLTEVTGTNDTLRDTEHPTLWDIQEPLKRPQKNKSSSSVPTITDTLVPTTQPAPPHIPDPAEKSYEHHSPWPQQKSPQGQIHQLDIVVCGFGIVTLIAAFVWSITYVPSTRLAVSSTPLGAHVFLNGISTQQKTPVVLWVPVQPTYRVIMRLEGYDSCRRHVRPRHSSEDIMVECELQRSDPDQNLTEASSKL
ncbi:MAG: serine/threonine protein kinase [Myxococcales bacterium]|nr:serine/threonine protein kinase [Myxococcales bacterium]